MNNSHSDLDHRSGDRKGETSRKQFSGQEGAQALPPSGKVAGMYRSGRRIVRLSRVDQERLARGEITQPEEAVHLLDARGVYPKKYAQAELAQRALDAAKKPALTAREKEILAQVPPHFGKL
ncbi:hypothetical protein [Arcanobacterium hippocoleae]|uniref:hypothetical protein n=1 Tax=Arcanobacterium hippocoleae TaxID=149017 RepID=UPI00334156E4